MTNTLFKLKVFIVVPFILCLSSFVLTYYLSLTLGVTDFKHNILQSVLMFYIISVGKTPFLTGVYYTTMCMLHLLVVHAFFKRDNFNNIFIPKIGSLGNPLLTPVYGVPNESKFLSLVLLYFYTTHCFSIMVVMYVLRGAV